MKTLGKILGIGTLALASLVGCTRNYNIGGKVVRYNKSLSTPMVVIGDSEKVSYQRTIKWNSLPATGKDISMIYLFKNDDLFPTSVLLLPYNTRDSAEFNKKIKEFDYYLNKIDSIENSKGRSK